MVRTWQPPTLSTHLQHTNYHDMSLQYYANVSERWSGSGSDSGS